MAAATCALGVACARAAPGPPGPPDAALERVPAIVSGPLAAKIDDLLRRASAFGFNGQVLVEKDDALILNQAYGFADHASGRKMTPETPVGIASMSKQFVAAAVLALEDDGRVDVRDRVGDLVPGLEPPLADATLHELLTHTAGLRSGDPFGDFEASSRAAMLERIARWPVLEPRGEWRYANVGYNLLAEVIERASRVPYEAFLAQRLFARAGMSHTGFWHEPPTTPEPPSHAYRGWYDTGSPETWPDNHRVRGAGDILSTAADLYRWHLALRSGAVLDPATARRAASPQAAIDEGGNLWYGYGLFVAVEEDGDTLIEHGGDWQGGFNGVTFLRPADRVLIVITSNGRDGDGQWLRHAVQREVDLLATGTEPEEEGPPPSEPLSDERVRALPGVYELEGGGRLVLEWDGSRMWLHPRGDPAAALLRAGRTDVDSAALRAGARTEALLAGIAAGEGEEAYRAALSEDGAPHFDDYWSEWRGVEARHGPLRGHEIIGSDPLVGGARTVHVELLLERRSVPMTFFWGDAGRGRLAGTFVRDAPNMEPLLVGMVVRADPDGGLVAHDTFRGRTLRFRFDDPAGLAFSTANGLVEARRAGGGDFR